MYEIDTIRIILAGRVHMFHYWNYCWNLGETKMKDYYWAHPFGSRGLHNGWKERFAKVGIMLLDPFYDLERPDVDELRQSYNFADSVELVERDLAAIDGAKGMLALVDGDISIGTLMEIRYGYTKGHTGATYRDFPVYIIVTDGRQGHPWLQYHATKIFTSVEQALDYFGKDWK